MIVKRSERQPWISDEQDTLTEGMYSTPCRPLNELQGTVCIMQPNLQVFWLPLLWQRGAALPRLLTPLVDSTPMLPTPIASRGVLAHAMC